MAVDVNFPESPKLPAAVANAKLPANYEAAKLALATCERLDEVAAWADKAAALRAYEAEAAEILAFRPDRGSLRAHRPEPAAEKGQDIGSAADAT